MPRTTRYLLYATGLLLAVFLVLGLLPTRGLAVEYLRPHREVNCGSVFVANEWTNDDGCEKSILARMPWMGGALALSVLSALGAGVLLVVAHDMDRARDRRGSGPADLGEHVESSGTRSVPRPGYGGGGGPSAHLDNHSSSGIPWSRQA